MTLITQSPSSGRSSLVGGMFFAESFSSQLTVQLTFALNMIVKIRHYIQSDLGGKKSTTVNFTNRDLHGNRDDGDFAGQASP